MSEAERVIQQARAEARTVMLEHEVLQMLAELGLGVPRHQFIAAEAITSDGAITVEQPLVGGRGVLKVVSEAILHKSDVGGVVFIDELTAHGVQQAARRILAALPESLRGTVRGFLLVEAVTYERSLGHELIVGARRSDDFGLVFTVGLGGTAVEALGAAAPGQTTVLFKPGLTSDEQLADKVGGALFGRWLCGDVRGVAAVTTSAQLVFELRRWTAALEQICARAEAAGAEVAEIEINPLVWVADTGDGSAGFMPLDALMRIGPAPAEAAEQGPPLDRLRQGLHPRSVALVGVSATKVNVGRIILRCMLQGGFDPAAMSIIREGDPIDGVSCVPSVSQLPQPVDLLIVAVGAAAAVDVLDEAITSGKAGAVLLIPGGMGETEQGRSLERRIVELLRAAPASRRPAVIGNNSLGLVSTAARFDSLFIPREKLPRRVDAPHTGAALISQSGAFMITQLTRLSFLNPALQASIGNQIDARLSHFVELAAERSDLHTLALYVEGFKRGDGERLASVVKGAVAAGRDVIVYKAGRSPAGQAAAMGHTASVAGDYRAFVELLGDAGALVAGSLSDFTDLVRLSVTLGRRSLVGRRVALMSNAGYEAVAMADSLQLAGLELAQLSPPTRERIAGVLDEARIGGLVSAANPLDLTPMAPDAVHERCMRALLDEPAVDVAVFGNVPLTSAIQSLPPGIVEGDRFDADDGYANRTMALFDERDKPFVVVIDAGELYDPLANYLQAAGLPVFRRGDRAVRLLGRYLGHRLGAARA